MTNSVWRAGTVVLGLAFGLLTPSARADQPVQVAVKSTKAATEAPVVVPAPASLKQGVYTLTAPGKRGVPVQVYESGGKTWLAAVFPKLAEGTETYSLQPSTEKAGVELLPEGGAVEVKVGGKPFLTYQTTLGPKPFYWPIYGPTGARITRAYPMEKVEGEKTDHPHQRSLWFTHGKVNGIDFWSEMKNHGSIKETSRKLVTSGPVLASIVTTDDWLGPDGTKVCEDTRTVRFYNVAATRVLDFDIEVRASEGPVVFGDTKEGMFGIRVPTSMDVTSKKGGKITNAEGLNDEAAWGKASPWVDYTGPVEGKTLGIAILNHPESFRHATTWHVRTYGLFAANPFGLKDFNKANKPGDYTIPKGESIRFQYRVVFHEGDTASAKVGESYGVYATPPTIEVLKD